MKTDYWWNRIVTAAIIFSSIFTLCFPVCAYNEGYPKLANYYLNWSIDSDQEARELAKWDLLILDMEMQVYSPQMLTKLKQYNPNIKLLAYVTSQEIRNDSLSLYGNSLRKRLYQQIDDQWWLKDANGNRTCRKCH